MDSFFAELKRRHIYRVAAAYAVVAWVLLQIVNNIAPGLSLPNWVVTSVIVALAVGFPIALIFAWIHQLAPADGVAPAAKTGRLDWVLIGALVVVIGLVSYQQLAPSPGAKNSQQASVATAPQPGTISLAVLPFVNLSDDRAQEFFSDGMTEEITTALAKVQGLIVIGRTSAFEFKGQNRDLRAIGQALGATHLIEGSVRKDGDSVRITAQLIRADSGAHLWAENYDRKLTDIFAIQEDIAQAIVGALRVPLGLAQGESLVSNRTQDLDSYQQYLLAKSQLRARAIEKTITILEPLIARDPNYAPASALLAYAYYLLPSYSSVLRTGSIEEAGRAQQADMSKGEIAARRAIQLDLKNAFGYGALGAIQYVQGKLADADSQFTQALRLDPSDPEILQAYSVNLAGVGRLRDSLAIREKMRTLEPFVPIYNVTTSNIMQLNGQSAASIPILEAMPADTAGGYYRNVYLAEAYAAVGRFREAADTLLFITGNQVSRQSVDDAARLLRQAPTNVSAPETLPKLDNELNFVYAYLGAADRMLEFPERIVKIGFGFSNPFRQLWLPEAAPVRKTERFKAFVRKAGLVDYWRARGWPDHCRPMGADDFVCD